MTHDETMGVCLDEELLFALGDERSDLDPAVREAATEHAARCAHCAAQMQEQRRFRTLLLRARVPGLGAEQWRALDQRIGMLGTEPQPRRVSIGARTYWGLTLAAAAVAVVVGVGRFLDQQAAEASAASVASTAPDRAVAVTPTGAIAPALGVVRVDGTVAVIDGAGLEAGALQPGANLAVGSTLRADAPARIALAGTAVLDLAAGTEVRVDAANTRDFFVRIRHGEVGLQVDKRAPEQRFAVLAGSYRAAVVGTQFRVRLGEDASVEVEVREGAVRVDEAAQGDSVRAETTVVVRAGRRWQARGGQILVGPIPSADAPTAIPGSAANHVQAESSDPEAGDGEETPNRASQRSAGERRAVMGARAIGGVHSDGTVFAADGLPMAPTPAPAPKHRVLIEVPPQAMTAEEIRRAKAAEHR
ncbi:MAG: FecR domain-containing protein [Deltaproteobacteria bacterium]|nr:FecR domain-containing protein [Deltaproteobacteria bacterium]